MPMTAAGFVHQDTIDSAVSKVANRFSSQVVRIRYSLGEDSLGDPSVFVRVLVFDEAAPLARLKVLARDLPITLMNELKTEENGLYTYFTFRSVYEQEKLRDPAWD